MNDFIYDGQRHAPEIHFSNLIIFDLSILATTELPILIMRLYMQSKKQIFISFDKQEAFDNFTSKTVRDTSVTNGI